MLFSHVRKSGHDGELHQAHPAACGQGYYWVQARRGDRGYVGSSSLRHISQPRYRRCVCILLRRPCSGVLHPKHHSISRSEVCTGWISKIAPSQVPAVVLGMLGVDEDFKGMGLGAALLRDAVLNASKVAAIAGARTLVVDPVEERRRFTATSDFVEFAIRDEWRSSCSVMRPDRAVRDSWVIRFRLPSSRLTPYFGSHFHTGRFPWEAMGLGCAAAVIESEKRPHRDCRATEGTLPRPGTDR